MLCTQAFAACLSLRAPIQIEFQHLHHSKLQYCFMNSTLASTDSILKICSQRRSVRELTLTGSVERTCLLYECITKKHTLRSVRTKSSSPVTLTSVSMMFSRNPNRFPFASTSSKFAEERSCRRRAVYEEKVKITFESRCAFFVQGSGH